LKTTPDHHDAELILKLYDLRREAVMRANRVVMTREFMPKSWEDVEAIMTPDHPNNAALRQVCTYWEMAYGFARHGVICAELLAESAGEGILIYTKVHPFLARIRENYVPTAFKNTEWIVENTSAGKRYFEYFQARFEKARLAAAAK